MEGEQKAALKVIPHPTVNHTEQSFPTKQNTGQHGKNTECNLVETVLWIR